MSSTATMSRWGALHLLDDSIDPAEIGMETVPCPGCDGTAFVPLMRARDHLTGLGGLFSIVRCQSCNLVLTNPRPDTQSLGYFYPSDYSAYDSDTTGKQDWWSRTLEHSALRLYYGYPKQPVGPLGWLLAQIAKSRFRDRRSRHEWIPFRSPGRLLDVGCGAGGFLKRMRSFGWSVTGIDLAADVAKRVQQEQGIPVHIGTLPHPALAAGSFDAVTMWHVLEHVPNPRVVLRSAADLLRPDGMLVVEVPNIASWSFAEFGPDWFGLELPRHFQHFDPETLSSMLPPGRFRNIEVQQIGTRSLIRDSATRAVESGREEYRSWLRQGKSFWAKEATRTETEDQADIIRLTAQRV